jgi:hypothetical protein
MSDTEKYRPAIEAAMDAAREAFRRHGWGEIEAGAMFFELGDGQRLAGAYPSGDYLVSANLAGEAAMFFAAIEQQQ